MTDDKLAAAIIEVEEEKKKLVKGLNKQSLELIYFKVLSKLYPELEEDYLRDITSRGAITFHHLVFIVVLVMLSIGLYFILKYAYSLIDKPPFEVEILGLEEELPLMVIFPVTGFIWVLMKPLWEKIISPAEKDLRFIIKNIEIDIEQQNKRLNYQPDQFKFLFLSKEQLRSVAIYLVAIIIIFVPPHFLWPETRPFLEVFLIAVLCQRLLSILKKD